MVWRHDSGWARMRASERFWGMAAVVNEQSRRRFCRPGSASVGSGRRQFDGAGQRTGTLDDLSSACRTLRHRVSGRPRHVRKKAADARRKTLEASTLATDLKELDAGRSDAVAVVTTRSLRSFVKEPVKMGHQVCPTVVGDLLRRMGYSLQANSKTQQDSKHIDRDAQFRCIDTQAKAFHAFHRDWNYTISPRHKILAHTHIEP
jgi:Rhodopirellula transposase DDE domain